MYSRIIRSRFSFLLPLAITLGLTLILFLLTLVFLELAGTFSTSEKSPSQRAFQTIGDATAIGTYIGFSVMIPLGAISTIILGIRRLVSRRQQSKN